MFTAPFSLRDFIAIELDRDHAYADVTGGLITPTENRQVRAVICSREVGVFSGKAVVEAFIDVVNVAGHLDRAGQGSCLVAEGAKLEVGTEVVEFVAPLSDVLRFERTLLNFLTHLCGVATETQKYVVKTRPFGVTLLATRKFLPGLRELQLIAVQAGGGRVHRRNLADGILIKENHQVYVPAQELLSRARASRSPLHRVEIEVQSMDELKRVLPLSPDIVMLDNFSLLELSQAIPYVRANGKTEIEVSGGVTLETISKIAELRPDSISVGAITHSVRALNLSLDIGPVLS